jgi:hypothetical protein
MAFQVGENVKRSYVFLGIDRVGTVVEAEELTVVGVRFSDQTENEISWVWSSQLTRVEE